MVQEQLLVILSLLLGIVMVTLLSRRLKVSYPILLVISGLLISLVPGMPVIALDPDLVFLIFLPPILFAAAWNTSWRDFWKLRLPIGFLSFGLVIFTAAAVAVVSHAVIPDFSLAFGFLLGGIISPPDAVAATSVLQGLKIPKRVVTILEGESLVNDAASLIVFRFALAAIITGSFSFGDAMKNFLLVAGMGIVIGVSIAFIVYLILRFFPTTTSMDAALTLLTPYSMYITAEHFHFSGVLAVVSGGLFLTFRSAEFFTYESRLHVNGFWATLIFLLNGFVFTMIGLQLPGIVNGLGNYSIPQAILFSVIISLVTIVIRIIWVFPGAYLPRMLSRKARETEVRPDWKSVFLVAWSGMRGIVSLASALAIPLTLADDAFPHRNLILFITFLVILVTLVLQGLSLKPIIRALNIETTEGETERINALSIRVRLAESVLAYLDTNYPGETQNNDAYKRVRDRYERMVFISRRKLESGEEDPEEAAFLPGYRQMLIELVHIRRRELKYFRYKGEFGEEMIREREKELDLEEARLNND